MAAGSWACGWASESGALSRPPANAIARRYTPCAAALPLLADVNEAYGQLSGPATKVILWHMYNPFRRRPLRTARTDLQRHIYNLRKSRSYRTGRLIFRTTRPTPVPIGVRCKLQPGGEHGFLRVDTVHLGDRGGEEGIYIINVVDEVAQLEPRVPSTARGDSGDIARRNGVTMDVRPRPEFPPINSVFPAATHKHSRVMEWIERQKRVFLHFTPTSASWLNLVERFFSTVTRKQIRRHVQLSKAIHPTASRAVSAEHAGNAGPGS